MFLPLIIVAALLALGGFQMLHTYLKAELPVGTALEMGGRESQASEPTGKDAFDSKRAMDYLESICKIGPRISGTDGMKKQQELVKKHFEKLGATVEFQRFRARQESQVQPIDMVNIIVTWNPDRERRVLVCSHYDTRPIADQEPDVRKWREPFISANDGGSGVALLMELGNQMKDLKTSVGVDFVLFDGEEYIFDPRPDHDKYFFGSDYFGERYKTDPPKYRYIGAVLLDMIGGKDARLPIEQNSWLMARPLVEELWRIAGREKCEAFKNELGSAVLDDHLALNKAGIPTVDLIDFNYPHWHRLTDVPANCSGDGLAQVAQVLTTWMRRAR
jgi:hypothetical protein